MFLNLCVREEYIVEKKFGRSLFGYSPGQVVNEIRLMDSEYQRRIEVLQSQIESTGSELKKSQEKAAELQSKLTSYVEREYMIAEVMLKAQKNAQKIEEEAKEKARLMMEKSEEELRRKLIELEFLRVKVERFRDEFRGILDEYKLSVESMKIPSNDGAFTPTLIVSDKTQAKGKDFSF